jgi:hypothetical protein
MKGKYPTASGLLPKLTGGLIDLSEGKYQLHNNKCKLIRYFAGSKKGAGGFW